jgi:hypothetical protein
MKRIVSLFLFVLTALSAWLQGLKINEHEYFGMPGLKVMVFYDIYPEGHQGAIGIIQSGC